MDRCFPCSAAAHHRPVTNPTCQVFSSVFCSPSTTQVRDSMKHRMFAVSLLFVAACQQLATGPGQSQLRVETTGTTFTRGAAPEFAVIPFVVTNQDSRPIYLAWCGERLMAALDRREAGQWVQHSGDGCLTNQDISPVELAPGATVQSQRGVTEAGEYRLRLGSSGSPAEPSQWVVVSNEFTIQ